jgi:hypothetical protein
VALPCRKGAAPFFAPMVYTSSRRYGEAREGDEERGDR